MTWLNCCGLVRRYAVGCREFRGLKECGRCGRLYCWRHLDDHVCHLP